MMCEEEGCCLEQWYLYVHRLKSGFSRVDFGPLFIHDSWPPTAWAWIIPPDSGCFQLFPGASRGLHLPYKSPL
jgi:hypothetical protein